MFFRVKLFIVLLSAWIYAFVGTYTVYANHTTPEPLTHHGYSYRSCVSSLDADGDSIFTPPVYVPYDNRFDPNYTVECQPTGYPVYRQGICEMFPNYVPAFGSYIIDPTAPNCTAGSDERVHAYVCDKTVTGGNPWSGCGSSANYVFKANSGTNLSMGALASAKESDTGTGLECGTTVQLDIFNTSCTDAMIAEHYSVETVHADKYIKDSNGNVLYDPSYDPVYFPKDANGNPTFCLAKDAFVWYTGSCEEPVNEYGLIGRWDDATCDAISFWAGDPDYPDKPVYIQVYDGVPWKEGRLVSEGYANQPSGSESCKLLMEKNASWNSSVFNPNLCDDVCDAGVNPALYDPFNPYCMHGYSFPTPGPDDPINLKDNKKYSIWPFGWDHPFDPTQVPTNLRDLYDYNKIYDKLRPRDIKCAPVPPLRDIQGFIWEVDSETSCPADPDTFNYKANRIQSDEVIGGDSGVTLDVTGFSPGVTDKPWDPNSANYNYKIDDVPYNADDPTLSLCTNEFKPAGQTSFKYELSCVHTQNNSEVFTPGSNCTFFDLGLYDPNTINLGYRLVYDGLGWFTTVGGGVYAGADNGIGTDSLTVFLPYEDDVATSYSNKLITSDGILYSVRNFSAQDSGSVNQVSATNTFVSNIQATESWPNAFTFDPPAHAIEITDCESAFFGELSPENIYYTSIDCVNDALIASSSLDGKYLIDNIPPSEVVVVYVTPGVSDVLRFETNFVSANNRRLMFIVDGAVHIAREVGYPVLDGDPTIDQTPNIQAAIIASGDIDFEGTQNPNPNADPDITVIVEGPLVNGGVLNPSINFRRDRGESNVYPSVVVRYNPIYIKSLTTLENDFEGDDFTGLSNIDLTWEVLN
ncbi:MAG: hypothetical protein R3B92_00785 [Patescibacteria group bacterium]